MISEEYKLLFIHIPKNAGTAVRSHIRSNIDANITYTEWHYPLHYFYKKLDINNYFKFSFSRNPYSRLVSAFCYTYKNICDSSNYHWKNYPRSYPILSKYTKYNSIEDNFRDLVLSDDFQMVFDQDFPVHFKPQKEFLYHDKCSLDYIGQVENLDNDFKEALRMSNIDIDLDLLDNIKTINCSSRGKYELFYDNDIKDIVYHQYKDDFDLLSKYER